MLHTSDFLGPPPASRCRRPFLSTLARPPTRSHPPSRRLRVGAEVRRRVPTQDLTGRKRPRFQGPKKIQRPVALTAVRALRRRYVGAGSHIKTKPGPTSEGRPVRSRQNRNVAAPDPPPEVPSQPIRCRARSNHTAAARHWPLLRAPDHAVREVDTKADSPEAVDSQEWSHEPPVHSLLYFVASMYWTLLLHSVLPNG